jgi:hypothetical protein
MSPDLALRPWVLARRSAPPPPTVELAGLTFSTQEWELEARRRGRTTRMRGGSEAELCMDAAWLRASGYRVTRIRRLR